MFNFVEASGLTKRWVCITVWSLFVPKPVADVSPEAWKVMGSSEIVTCIADKLFQKQ